MTRMASGPYVIDRDGNVVRVDFRRGPEPPAPRFPGAGALRMADAPGPADAEVRTAALVSAA
jgi:hypothetical protein